MERFTFFLFAAKGTSEKGADNDTWILEKKCDDPTSSQKHASKFNKSQTQNKNTRTSSISHSETSLRDNLDEAELIHLHTYFERASSC